MQLTSLPNSLVPMGIGVLSSSPLIPIHTPENWQSQFGIPVRYSGAPPLGPALLSP